jgi:hypothetical protein
MPLPPTKIPETNNAQSRKEDHPMAENKTRPTNRSVTGFLAKIRDRRLRDDSTAILRMMRGATKLKPVMWGDAIIGFGTYHYVYESGREGDFFLIGFSPRKQNISLYFMGGRKSVERDLAKLGKYKAGGSCLYIKTLSDVNQLVLKRIIAKAYKEGKRRAGQVA